MLNIPQENKALSFTTDYSVGQNGRTIEFIVEREKTLKV